MAPVLLSTRHMAIDRISALSAPEFQGLPQDISGGKGSLADLISMLQRLLGVGQSGVWDNDTQQAFQSQLGGMSGVTGSGGAPRAEDLKLAVSMLAAGMRPNGGGNRAPMFGSPRQSGVSASGARDPKYFGRQLQSLEPMGSHAAIGASATKAATGASSVSAPSTGGGTYREQAAGLIKNFEGFRSKAYWDVNAYRVGYGTDTINGKKVTSGTRVTQAEATKSLVNEQIPKYEKTIRGQVGDKAFDGLPNATKASLISVGYNYGSLPNSVKSAVKTGSVDKIATSIEGLKGHNGGINAKRRAKEAAYARKPDAPTVAKSKSADKATVAKASPDKGVSKSGSSGGSKSGTSGGGASSSSGKA